MRSARKLVTSVIGPLTRSSAATSFPWMVAARLPADPSKVSVDFAASTAMGSVPSWVIAALNSSAVISPFSIASRKLPV